MENHLKIYGFTHNSIASLDAQSLSNVFAAYAENCAGEEIMEIGFNQNSGYVYIALENGIQIASCFGRNVVFVTTDFNDGEEYFAGTYEVALDNLAKLSH
jgi:hypothetical protein